MRQLLRLTLIIIACALVSRYQVMGHSPAPSAYTSQTRLSICFVRLGMPESQALKVVQLWYEVTPSRAGFYRLGEWNGECSRSYDNDWLGLESNGRVKTICADRLEVDGTLMAQVGDQEKKLLDLMGPADQTWLDMDNSQRYRYWKAPRLRVMSFARSGEIGQIVLGAD